MYGDAASPVFRIAKDVWDKGIWQAEVEYFLPVQMCHMRVNENTVYGMTSVIMTMHVWPKPISTI